MAAVCPRCEDLLIRTIDQLKPKCLRGLDLPQGAAVRGALGKSVRVRHFDRILYRHRCHAGRIAAGAIHCARNDLPVHKRSRPVMDQDDPVFRESCCLQSAETVPDRVIPLFSARHDLLHAGKPIGLHDILPAEFHLVRPGHQDDRIHPAHLKRTQGMDQHRLSV